MGAQPVSLGDRYTKRQGGILISGVQALVRLMLLQAERDRAAGLRTGGFVSGYRGSPLGTLDTSFAKARAMVGDSGIVVRPAVNEELGATAVAGSQQIAQTPGAKVDGVFSLWYGKGPGFDRASDAIRHGNLQGASPHGGVVLAVGDDHIAKSSSIICCSDDVAAGLHIPLFYPADPEEVVVYGLHCFAMSRLTGSWTALKIISEVADSTRVVSGNELDGEFVTPQLAVPAIGLHNRWPDTPLEQEVRQQDHRLPGVLEYVRVNGLDRAIGKTSGARIGLIAAGKSWLDLMEGLRLLGISDDRFEDLGIALYKPAMIWPLEPERIRAFALGLEVLIAVEEKGPLLENQVKTSLYGHAQCVIYGKAGPDGEAFFPRTGDLTPERIAATLGPILHRLTGAAELVASIEGAQEMLAVQAKYAVPPVLRKPFFCSGCPHNRSTVVPEGSRALSGIGCHGLAAYNRPAHGSFAQMGGEGIHWMGLAPFTAEPHIFANLGDGTYFHSGLLAIRQAVAANLNITYKLLYNDAVAMTGGQAVDGELSVLRLVDQLRAEGVGMIVISTDDVGRYPPSDPVRAKVDRVESRDGLDALQRELRDISGVSVIIYEQTCATEKRRLRKRDKLPTPDRRIFINELVCEGCGDCSVKSNCLSVEPIVTALGIKRRINQSSCNTDYSCVNGFCPSFVSIEGGVRRKPRAIATAMKEIPPPEEAANGGADRNQRIVVAGVGGTGIVTIGALLSMASHIGGLNAAVLDQVGMAQKGGAVASHINIGPEPIAALRVPSSQADLVIVCDQIVGNSRDVIAGVRPDHTRIVVNADVSITGDFMHNSDIVADTGLLVRRLKQRVGNDRMIVHPFTRLSEKLLGDAIGANLMMLGLAYQKGWLAMDLAALHNAIELNGVSIQMNLAAFDWGRRLAVDPQAVRAAADIASSPNVETLDDIIAHHVEFLTEYQNSAYAARYRDKIEEVRSAERGVSSDDSLTLSAASALFKLMAYKDEYEVARLYTDGAFERELASQFDGEVRISFHMAPPIFAGRDPATGHPRKLRFGGWMMPALHILARFRGLRGTIFDPFGRLPDRRLERELIKQYECLLDRLIKGLSKDNVDFAAKIAGLATTIRGFGHVKGASVAAYRSAVAEKLAEFESGALPTGALSKNVAAGGAQR